MENGPRFHDRSQGPPSKPEVHSNSKHHGSVGTTNRRFPTTLSSSRNTDRRTGHRLHRTHQLRYSTAGLRHTLPSCVLECKPMLWICLQLLHAADSRSATSGICRIHHPVQSPCVWIERCASAFQYLIPQCPPDSAGVFRVQPSSNGIVYCAVLLWLAEI